MYDLIGHQTLVDLAKDVAIKYRDDKQFCLVVVENAVQLAARATDRCEECDQPLGRLMLPATALVAERGYVENRGVWNHQHGCGSWNTPAEVTVVAGYSLLPDDVDRDELDRDDLIEYLKGSLEAALTDLMEQREAAREEYRESVLVTLRGEHQDAVEALATIDPTDPDDLGDVRYQILTANEVSPGSMIEGTGDDIVLQTWAEVPTDVVTDGFLQVTSELSNLPEKVQVVLRAFAELPEDC